MKNLFVIPARSGSKEIRDKNIKIINGLPMFAWSILHAKFLASSNDRICFSSDNERYLEIASNFEIDNHKRSKEFSNDNAELEPLLINLTKEYSLSKQDNVILLQPTSPFRSIQTLLNFKKLMDKGSESVVSLKEVHYFEWLKKDEYFKKNFKQRMPRQKITKRYAENGLIYLIKSEMINKEKNRNSAISAGLVCTDIESIEVDTDLDLELVNSISKSFNEQWFDYIRTNNLSEFSKFLNF